MLMTGGIVSGSGIIIGSSSSSNASASAATPIRPNRIFCMDARSALAEYNFCSASFFLAGLCVLSLSKVKAAISIFSSALLSISSLLLIELTLASIASSSLFES